eukprot:1145377-Amphidinium_carterae.1
MEVPLERIDDIDTGCSGRCHDRTACEVSIPIFFNDDFYSNFINMDSCVLRGSVEDEQVRQHIANPGLAPLSQARCPHDCDAFLSWSWGAGGYSKVQ